MFPDAGLMKLLLLLQKSYQMVMRPILVILDLPISEFREYFAPEYKLHLPVSNMCNWNSKDYLELVMYCFNFFSH